MGDVITVSNLTKLFKKRNERNFLSFNNNDYVTALDNISFSVQEGAALAIIGKNGSGKSTLLKILLGVYPKTSGEVNITKSINGILESGLGFHKDLTGYDNILILGKILGLPLNKIKQKIDEIIDFAELQKYIYTPLKHYSNGMISRLSFSVVRLTDAEIIVFDEVLAFGDVYFQQKAYQYLKQINVEGRTLIIVSHQIMGLIPICNRFLLLENGKLIKEGTPFEVVPIYYDSIANVFNAELANNKITNLNLNELYVKEISYKIDENNLLVEFRIDCKEEINNYDIGIVFRDFSEQIITTISLVKYNTELKPETKQIVFQIPLKYFNTKHLLLSPYIYYKKNGTYKLSSEPIVVGINNIIYSDNELLKKHSHIGLVNIPIKIELL